MENKLEILKLKEMLEEANIPFTFNDNLFGIEPDTTGYQIVIFGDEYEALCDAIYHAGSYGYREGLLEIMGGLTDEELLNDTVLGHLTAEEVFKRFKYCYENGTSVYEVID